MRKIRSFRWRKLRYGLLALTCGLSFAISASACILEGFQVSSEPTSPSANVAFDLIVDYQGSAGCINAETLFVEPPELRVEIDCNCLFVTTFPVPQQFRPTVAGLPAGQYQVSVFELGTPSPIQRASVQLLVGAAPAIPISPLALTLLSLMISAAAVWVLRR